MAADFVDDLAHRVICALVVDHFVVGVVVLFDAGGEYAPDSAAVGVVGGWAEFVDRPVGLFEAQAVGADVDVVPDCLLDSVEVGMVSVVGVSVVDELVEFVIVGEQIAQLLAG